jgi:hypothetical protein
MGKSALVTKLAVAVTGEELADRLVRLRSAIRAVSLARLIILAFSTVRNVFILRVGGGRVGTRTVRCRIRRVLVGCRGGITAQTCERVGGGWNRNRDGGRR